MPERAPPKFPIARSSAGVSHLREPGSVRRTTSIDSDWPEGYGQPWTMTGRARDLLTTEAGEAVELASAAFSVTASPKREILAIDTMPVHPRAQELVGVRAGGASREALRAIMGDLRGAPLFQLLDDYAGASLVAGWIWSEWMDGWLEKARKVQHPSALDARSAMENICTGFATGASSLNARGDLDVQSKATVGPLEHPADPLGWHHLPAQQGPQMRRARRIDVCRDGDVLRVDAGFQDSGTNPQGTRSAIHEYRVYAEVDARSMLLVSVQALPLILPFSECPGAAVKIGRLIGTPVAKLRESVPVTLPGTLGCTHLNDVLRGLADVPGLAEALDCRPTATLACRAWAGARSAPVRTPAS